MDAPVVVDFPLKGEWISPNTPGTKIPSHGTNLFGERYAYDFVGVEPGSRNTSFYQGSPLRYLLFGVRLRDCHGWGRPIFSATAGKVIQAEDGILERDPVHPLRDLPIMLKNARAANSGRKIDFRQLSGNFIIVESSLGYVVYAHAQTGSIAVTVGESVTPGQRLANVGHSGNSTAPHLHFQLMDHRDPWQAQGIPCCFRRYQVYENNAWRAVDNGIPKATDRLRVSQDMGGHASRPPS
jgi:murein DD-endopeptidase MepM/ murein hydrolase activator NlpD